MRLNIKNLLFEFLSKICKWIYLYQVQQFGKLTAVKKSTVEENWE